MLTHIISNKKYHLEKNNIMQIVIYSVQNSRLRAQFYIYFTFF